MCDDKEHCTETMASRSLTTFSVYVCGVYSTYIQYTRTLYIYYVFVCVCIYIYIYYALRTYVFYLYLISFGFW